MNFEIGFFHFLSMIVARSIFIEKSIGVNVTWKRGGMKTRKGLVISKNNHSHQDFLDRWYDM